MKLIPVTFLFKVLTDASEQIFSGQIVSPVRTLGTAARINRRLADTLAAGQVADADPAQDARNVAVALLATVGIVEVQVPVERPALVADASLHPVLALAQLASRHRATARKLGHHPGRIAVAF